MATPPTRVSSTATTYNTSTSPKTTASIAVNNGDILIAVASAEASSSVTIDVSTATGSTSAWTEIIAPPVASTNQSYLRVWSATATATGNITVTFTRSTTAWWYGGAVKVWRDSAGIGVVANNNNGTGSGVPSVTATLAANSGLQFTDSDWNATTGARTYTTTTGTITEDNNQQTTNYSTYGAYVPDTGAAGSKTTAMSAPTSQRWIAGVIEILGTTSTVTTVVDPFEQPKPLPRWTPNTVPFLAFVPLVAPIYTWRNQWPDFAPPRPNLRPLRLHDPWDFIGPPAQVWRPYGPWQEPVRRKPFIDTNQFFVPPQVTPAITWSDQTNWPDFAPGKKPNPLYLPWSFVPPPAQVWYPQPQWPDFIAQKKRPTETTVQAFVVVPTERDISWESLWIDPLRRRPFIDTQQPFVFTPVAAQQDWYPPNSWPDILRRKPQPIDTQPWAFTSLVPEATAIQDWPDFVRRKPWPIDTLQPFVFTPAPEAVTSPWPYWPDSVPGKRRPLNFDALAFVPPVPQVWYPPNYWPDIINRKKQPIDTQPEAFVYYPPAPQVVVSPWPSFEDFARGPRRPLNFDPLAFVQPPVQVWYPTAPWPDYIVRKKQPIDTQPTAFVQIVTPAATFMVVSNWPDTVPGQRRPLNFDAFTIGRPPTVPNTGYSQWPDFARAKRPPLNYVPLTFVQTVRTPWNNMTQWPDFAPIRGKKGLHAALQQVQARYPDVIPQATITGIMAAFETNSDTADFAIYVIPSTSGGPAVRAYVSIEEVPIPGSATSIFET